jgi:hypothetical protein
VQKATNEAGISKTSCHEILTEKFGIQRFVTKLVPSLLTYEQKQKRLETSQGYFTVQKMIKTF